MFKYDCRYHAVSSEHKMKEDYEAIALAKAEAKGPKEVLALFYLDVLDLVLGEKKHFFLQVDQYRKKLARDIKRAKTGK